MSGTGVNSYAAGYMALRYLAKQADAERDPDDDIIPTTTDDTSTDDDDTTTTDTLTPDDFATVETGDNAIVKIVGATNSDVWLGGVNPFTGDDNIYGNADAVTLDASEMTDAHFLGGNDNDNVIIAGVAGSSIWGGNDGDDILIGGAGVDNFWFTRGGDDDTVLNFRTGRAGDVLTFLDGGITNIFRAGTNFEVTLDDGSALTVATDDESADNIINYTTDGANVLRVKIGDTTATNDFIYDGDDTAYLGGNNVDALHVNTAGAGVNLGALVTQNLEVLDATSGGGNILVGNSGNNFIMSGGNNSLLWGAAGDDTLVGGAGVDTFMYGAGDGNDIITGAEDDDVINIHNANLSDITVSRTDFGCVIGINGGALAVVGNANPTVTFADGSTYKLNS